MENAANGILFSTSTGHSEIDELNRILTVERELVLKTQENYRSLKGKYLELSEENELLKKELAILRQDYSEQGSFKENFVSLEAKSRHLIKQMAADNEAREMRYEKFRTDTLSELQKVFRKEIADQNSQIEHLNAEKDELINENDQLLEQLKQLRMDVSDLKRKEKSREEAIRMEYDGKLQEILEKEEKSKESRTAANHGDLAAMRDEMSRLEERLLAANRDKTAAIVERNAKIDAAAVANVELRQQVAELNAKLDAVNGELSIFKSHESQKEAEVTELHRKISSLMTEKIDLEADHRRKERSWEVRMGQVEENFSKKLLDFEVAFSRKGEIINDLRNKLEELGSLKEALENSDRNASVEKETRIRLELEVKKLYQKIEKLNEEKEAQISSIKMERDRLECSVAELKKKLEVTPETVAEAQRLRNQLQNSERRQREAKEKYHSALGEMQAALRMVEKQQKNTQIKIQQSILSNRSFS